MIIIDDIEQGTSEWLKIRLGVISASRASEFSVESKQAPMPDDAVYVKDGKDHVYNYAGIEYRGTNKAILQGDIRSTLPAIYGDMRQSYMCDLVGQVATGNIPPEMSFKQCEWGKDHEHEARACFEFETGLEVDEIAFIYRDESKRFGLSPDGLIKGLVGGKQYGLELKCPFTTKVFIEFAVCDKIKKEYYEQCQYSMWITGYDGWYFANYDPRVKGRKLYYSLIERDENYMAKYDQSEVNFISDMNEMLITIGAEFGSQWEAEY